MDKREKSGLTRNEQYWRKDSQGHHVPPQLQSEYLDWLLDDDRYPETEDDWAKLNGIARDTVRKWKQDRRFKELWERRATERSVSPERIHDIVGILYDAAKGTGDVQAAKQFLLYAEKLMPPKEIRRDNSVAHMTDAELCAEVEAILTRFSDAA